MKQSVTILGSTGSVGRNTLEVIRYQNKHFRVAALAAGSKVDELLEQIHEFKPKAVYLHQAESSQALAKRLPKNVRLFTPKDGLEAFVRFSDADILMAAASGTDSLPAVLSAVKAGKKVAVANKEILVVAGSLLTRLLKRNPKAKLVPVDSEHSAIFQCLLGHDPKTVDKLILTSSGGPLKDIAANKFKTLTKEFVINHPRWRMGKKISVDSATMMNKGLEIIEAASLFGVPIEKIEVLVHPEAIVHSMVAFRDGSTLAQLGVTDMKLPIQYALSYPDRLEVAPALKLDLASVGALHFVSPDRAKFPCLDLAYEVARRSGSAPCVLSAADEVAVTAYLDDKITFVQIPRIIENVLAHHRHIQDPDLKDIQEVHAWALEETRRLCKAL